MIKVDTHVIDIGNDIRTDIEIVIGIPAILDDMRREILAAELTVIFKKLHEVDPEILLDALESYEEDLKND